MTTQDFNGSLGSDSSLSTLDDSGRYLAQLAIRPNPLDGICLPTVRNIEEAELLCCDFDAVITAGPTPSEVVWGHENHGVWMFQDTTNAYGPQLCQVEEMIEFGVDHDDLLVHCHAGISRSTATAWGIAIARGADPEAAFAALRRAHPLDEYDLTQRMFCPNRLLVEHLQVVLGNKDLLKIRQEYLADDPETRWWV